MLISKFYNNYLNGFATLFTQQYHCTLLMHNYCHVHNDAFRLQLKSELKVGLKVVYVIQDS